MLILIGLAIFIQFFLLLVVTLNIPRTSNNPDRCLYPTCRETCGLLSVPLERRYVALKNDCVYVTKRARICKTHFEANEPITGDEWIYGAEQIEDLVQILREDGRAAVKGIADNELIEYIGISAEQFQDLLMALPSLKAKFQGDMEKSRLALQVFLVRLRTGHTYQKICAKFDISLNTVKKYINCARKSLLEDFVPIMLGFESITREQLIENQSVMARNLHTNAADQAIVVADGTYIYCNKSKNYEIQRNTYNDQKKRNFIKPMVFVTTNGYFIDVIGPFEATKNDAAIMSTIFESHEATIMNKLNANDVFLLDRGFRDCGRLLEERGFIVKMPEFITKADKTGQLTPKKANDSRLVTACRFVIESRNGNMKTVWGIFSQVWATFDLPHLIDDYRIGAALINRYFNRIESNKYDADQIAREMITRKSDMNEFARIVGGCLFQRNVKNFYEVSLTTLDLPTIEKDQFKNIALGSYQIAQIASYCIEALEKNDGRFVVYTCPISITESIFADIIRQKDIEHPIILRTTMYSRFSKSKKYAVYILIDKHAVGSDSVIEYCCECRHGLRKVGCCGHVMAFISYATYYCRHEEECRKVAPFMDNFFVSAA